MMAIETARTLPALTFARSTITIVGLYSRFILGASVITGLGTLSMAYLYATYQSLLLATGGLQGAGEAVNEAREAAVREGTYTKKELDNMPIFFVFKAGPSATPEIWQNDSEAMNGN